MSGASTLADRHLPKVYAALAGIILVAGLMLIPPDPEQQVQRLIADGRHREAQALVERIPSTVQPSERALADRVDLSLHLGRIGEAAALLDEVLERSPDLAWARERKGEIIATIGSFEDREAWAADSFARDPVREDFLFLIGAARMRGEIGTEAELLERGIATGLAEAPQIERLGHIRAAQGDRQAAIALLSDAVTMADRPGLQTRLTLFALMTEAGQTYQAIAIAKSSGLDVADPTSVDLYAFHARGPDADRIIELIAAE